MRKGSTSPTDFYYIILVVFLLVMGAYSMIVIGGSYSLQNPKEGIGFRELSLLNTYNIIDGYKLFLETKADINLYNAIESWTTNGLQPIYSLKKGCGDVAGYKSWYRDGNGCFDSQNSLFQHISSVFDKNFQHPIFSPVHYNYKIKNGLLTGNSEQSEIAPIMGIYDMTTDDVEDIISSQKIAESMNQDFSPDYKSTEQTIPDNGNSRNGKIKQVVLIRSGTNTLKEITDMLTQTDMSVHYVVGTDGSIIQMVPENNVANTFICSEKQKGTKKQGSSTNCKINNDDVITVMLVNKGWYVNDKQTKYYENCPPNYKLGNNDDPKLTKKICWQNYPAAEISSAIKLVGDILSRNNLLHNDIITTDDNNIFNTGPLFDMVDFKHKVLIRPVQQISQGTNLKKLVWPTTDHTINSCYGKRVLNGNADFHDGIDISGNIGNNVKAIADGTVYSVCNDWQADCHCSLMDGSSSCPNKCNGLCGNFGNTVVIKHSDNLFSRYSHLDDIIVNKEDKVFAGKVIGHIGNTGKSEGPHLDLKIYTSEDDINKKDKAKNPFCFFDQSTLKTLKPSSNANSCKTKYSIGSTTGSSSSSSSSSIGVDMSFTNDKLVDECKSIGFSGIPRTGACYTDLLSSTPTGDLKKVGDTKKNLNNIPGVYEVINKAAKTYDLPPSLILGIITQESVGKPHVVSSTGAAGIMQFTASTAKNYGLNNVVACCDENEAKANKCNINPVCTVSNDERFDPNKAIPAGAHYISDLIHLFRNYPDSIRTFLAVQSYNTGPSAVKTAYDDCKKNNNPTKDCVTKTLLPSRKKEAYYANDVLKWVVAWGGGTRVVDCDDKSIKNLGYVSFKPDFEIKSKDFNFKKLIEWAKDTSKLNDNLNKGVVKKINNFNKQNSKTKPLQLGFCNDENPMKEYLREVVLTLEECESNGQNECGCELPPPKNLLTNGLLTPFIYTLTFGKSGIIKLTKKKGISLNEEQISYKPFDKDIIFNFIVTKKGTMNNKEFDKVNIKIIDNNVETELKPDNNRLFLFKTKKGTFDVDDTAPICFPTKKLFPFCKQTDYLTIDNKPIYLKFSLALKDDNPPAIPSVKFNTMNLVNIESQEDDVVGYLVYCGLNMIPQTDNKKPKRLFGKKVNYDIKDCVGTPLLPPATNTYNFNISVIDSGGNLAGPFIKQIII